MKKAGNGHALWLLSQNLEVGRFARTLRYDSSELAQSYIHRRSSMCMMIAERQRGSDPKGNKYVRVTDRGRLENRQTNFIQDKLMNGFLTYYATVCGRQDSSTFQRREPQNRLAGRRVTFANADAVDVFCIPKS